MDIALWVRMIMDGIKRKNINPWEVNIADVADYYINKIKELRKFDIRLSADVILVGGILLRMKSESLYESFIEKKEKRKIRKNPKTVNELIETIEEELKKVKKRSRKKNVKKDEDYEYYNINEIIDELVESEDIDKIIENLLKELKEDKIIIFQEKFKSKDEKIKYFLPSLYLANEGKAEIIQEKMFDKLIIKIKE
ncbi:segregation/condensation protein A [Methanocaldococcus villosus]|uniref:segregation/condensation protein A n=1 Tax=Methanocaldococcus villosus TaxID=667126 RepID=UPI0003702A67|nr:segregation/condensation protein A [Methanocaldococcus villosus]